MTQDREEVPVATEGFRLEFDSIGPARLIEEAARDDHVILQLDRSLIEHHQIHPSGLKDQRQLMGQRCALWQGGFIGKEDSQVIIAHWAGLVLRLRTKEVDEADVMRRGQSLEHSRLDGGCESHIAHILAELWKKAKEKAPGRGLSSPPARPRFTEADGLDSA